MIELTDKSVCCGCSACATSCRQDCIEMVMDTEGFRYPLINETKCNDCGVCIKRCPSQKEYRSSNQPAVYAVWNQNDLYRKESSSGGVFKALMDQVLLEGGIVFGAAFDETMTLRHIAIRDEKESRRLMGSKYLQSETDGAFRETRQLLNKGKRVLFSGTPCQIAGLYACVDQDDKNLLTCDLVCHGVPSPKVFASYIAMLERKHGSKVRKINFRDKISGWNQYSVSIFFSNGEMVYWLAKKDPFILGFLRNIYLRPSCHNCRFSKISRIADITLGDFWGLNTFYPEWDDDRGTSLILVQTSKGSSAVDACSHDLVVHEADLEKARKFNPSIYTSSPASEKRSEFFIDFGMIPFEEMIDKYMSPTKISNKFINVTKSIGRKGINYLRRLPIENF